MPVRLFYRLSTLESSFAALVKKKLQTETHLIALHLPLVLALTQFCASRTHNLTRSTLTHTHTHRQVHTVQHKLAINSKALISRRPTFILSPEQGEIFTRVDSTRLELRLQQVCCLSLFLNGRSSLLPKSFVLQRKKENKFMLLFLFLLLSFAFDCVCCWVLFLVFGCCRTFFH